MPVKVKTIARQAADEALAASLRQAIAAQLTEELVRRFAQPPLKDELGRAVRAAVAEALAALDWENGKGRVGFSRR